MDLTLDYNVELFPLDKDQSFTLALASSLARGAPATASGDPTADDDEKEKDVWRPDGKGRRGLEEDYDYVMYGKVRQLVLIEAQAQHSRSTSLMAERRKLCR